MKCESKPFILIQRRYEITSGELKKSLGIEGEITGINLWSGRSPNDEERGVSPDKDIWEINTTEKKKR
jgi:hypothetical protein